MSPDLDIPLLYRMLRELGELRLQSSNRVSVRNFDHLIEQTGDLESSDERQRYLSRHLDFLEQSGFIEIRAKLGHSSRARIHLTLSGQKFVQPGLAEFGSEPLLPEVVRSIEQQIHGLTQPQQEKETLIFKLRAAIAKQAPDLVVKFLVELAARTLK